MDYDRLVWAEPDVENDGNGNENGRDGGMGVAELAEATPSVEIGSGITHIAPADTPRLVRPLPARPPDRLIRKKGPPAKTPKTRRSSNKAPK